jgi:hypothetical protein
VFENGILNRVFGSERAKARGGWNYKMRGFTTHFEKDRIKEVKMGGTCDIYGKEE